MSRSALRRPAYFLAQPVAGFSRHFPTRTGFHSVQQRLASSLRPIEGADRGGHYSAKSLNLALGSAVLASFLCTLLIANPDRLDSWKLLAPVSEYQNPNMPGETPPGRPGNLTADEQVKLQEAWR